MHILLVEDNPGDARLLQVMLAEAGNLRWQVTHADRLLMGLAHVAEGSIDVVLLDLTLPDSHGVDTLIRMHAAAKGVPIVVLTGVDDEALGVQLVQTGAQDYLVKGQVTQALLVRSLRYAAYRKRAEDEVRGKTQILQSVLDSLTDGVVVASETGQFLVWNPAAHRIVGAGPAEMNPKQWSEHYALFLPDMVTPYPSDSLPLVRAMRGEAVDDDLVFVRGKGHPDGVWLSVNARPLQDEDGTPKGGVAAFRDITEHKRAEEDLRESEARTRLLLESTGEGIYGVDLQGRCTFINTAALKMLGYRHEDVLGNNMHALIHHSRPDGSAYPCEECRIYRAFRSGKGSQGEDEVLWRQDRTPFPVEYSSYPIIEHSLVTGAVVTFTDITERKRAEEALRESRRALLRSQEELRALTAKLLSAQDDERRRVSRDLHDDLNQRLAMLAVDTDALVQHLPDSRPVIADRLRSLGSRLVELSDDVQRIAYQLHPSILDHLGLAIAVQSYVEDFAKRERVKVTFTHTRLPKSLPQDIASCLYRVTQECLRNIAKHARATRASITLTGSSKGIHLSIKDSGIGFSPDAVRDRGGGLGLLSMQERVRLVNGDFRIQSRPGQGTEVSAQIPLPRGMA